MPALPSANSRPNSSSLLLAPPVPIHRNPLHDGENSGVLNVRAADHKPFSSTIKGKPDANKNSA
jgi:hypothetical protein